MGWIRTFWTALAGPRRLPGVQSPAPGAYPSAAAASVTFDTALTVSAWWAGVRLLCETVAGLPINMYRLGAAGRREPDTSHQLWQLLNLRPNRYQTRVEFVETLMLNLVTSGNAYVAVERAGNMIVSLLPLMSAQMTTELMSDGSVVHRYETGTNVRYYSADSIWHIKLFGNGVIGLSPLAHARQALGIALATENRVSAIHRNGGKPTGLLMIDKTLTPAQRATIRENLREMAEGNNDNLFVLEAGMKYEQVSMTPEDMELLASRRFQLEDVARFLGVPSVLINDTSGTTAWGSGIGQLIDGFYKLNLRPYLERIENSARVHLLPAPDRWKWEIEFDFDALLRMDQPKRFEGYQKGIGAGVLTPNEARGLEGWAPKPGGDSLLVQGAMVPLQSVRARPQSQEVPRGNETDGA